MYGEIEIKNHTKVIKKISSITLINKNPNEILYN